MSVGALAVVFGLGGLVVAALTGRRRAAPPPPPPPPAPPITTTPTGGAQGSGPTGDTDDDTTDDDAPPADDTTDDDTPPADTDDESTRPVPRDLYGRLRTGQALARYRAALALDNMVSGARTYRATGGNRPIVEAAQRDLGVRVDGVIGPETLAQMAEALVSAPSPSEIPSITTADQWRQRTVARRFAFVLDCHISQERTPRADLVREAQRSMGEIAVDGRVGDETRTRAAYLLRGPLAAEDAVQRAKQVELFGPNGERAPEGV